jgi:capsular exopolysaccharide synthesis family protein
MSRVEEALRRARGESGLLGAVEGPTTATYEQFLDRPTDVPMAVAVPAASESTPDADATPAPPAAETPDPSEPRALVEEPDGPEPPDAAWTLESATGTHPIAQEQYRRLAAALHKARLDHGTKVVMVVSALPGEGKTLTSSNLAMTLGGSFRYRVLLIEADMRRPRMQDVFGFSPEGGLAEVLAGRLERQRATLHVTRQLDVLPAGRPTNDPVSGLVSPRLRDLVDGAASDYDWIVIDTPPIEILPDSHLLAEMADAAVLVVKAGHTAFAAVQRAIGALGRDRILGVVLNRAEEKAVMGDYYQYYTGYFAEPRP